MILRRAKNGFTLLELVLVLAILTVVMALIAPSLQGFAAGRSGKNLATNLIALTNYARTQSVTEGRAYRLNFDPAARTFFLTYESGATFQAPEGDFGQPVQIAQGLSVETTIPQLDDGQYVTFRSDGRTDAASIRITDRFSSTVEVACLSATETYKVVSPGARQ